MRGLTSLPPFRDDRLTRARALLIARIAIVLYLLELLLNLTRPHVLADETALSIFYKLPKGFSKQSGFSGSLERLLNMPRFVFWTVLAGIVAGVAIQIFAAVTRQSDRRLAKLTWLTLGCLLLPFGLIPLSVVIEYAPLALACLPGTVFVLLLLHSGVRFVRVPPTVLLAAFGWGALIVFGLGRAYTGLAFGTLFGYLGKPALTDSSRLMTAEFRVIDLVIVHISIVNTLAVAAGVVLLLMLFRHRVTDAVTGLTLGAAVGLGYNFVESILFIKIYGTFGGILGSSGGFEYWIRQSIGLLGGQVTFGALLGAGLGVAAKARQRGLVATAAIVAAIGGTTAMETLSGWLSGRVESHVDRGSALDTLVISPLLWLLLQLPFMALVVTLLIRGLRERAVALRAAVTEEAATRSAGSAIAAGEVRVLVSPVLRFWAAVSTWRWYGRESALALHRLQSAQLELASWRVQQDPDPAISAKGDELRSRVWALKGVRPEVTP